MEINAKANCAFMKATDFMEVNKENHFLKNVNTENPQSERGHNIFQKRYVI